LYGNAPLDGLCLCSKSEQSSEIKFKGRRGGNLTCFFYHPKDEEVGYGFGAFG